MNKKVNKYQLEPMLRFITPVYRHYAIELLNVPDCRVKHHYIRCQTDPVRIILHEHTYMMNNLTDCMYLLSIKGNDLMLDCCIETNYLGEATSLNNGYPYIRMPEKENKLLRWEYLLFEDISVYCTAIIERQKILGIEYEVLTVKRTFRNTYSSHTSIELYIAGLGLHSKQGGTNDSGNNHLPAIFKYSLN